MTAIERSVLRRAFPFASVSATVQLQMRYASTTPGSAEIDLVRLKWRTLPTGCTSFGYFLVRDGTGPFNLQETFVGCEFNVNNDHSNLDTTKFPSRATRRHVWRARPRTCRARGRGHDRWLRRRFHRPRLSSESAATQFATRLGGSLTTTFSSIATSGYARSHASAPALLRCAISRR